MFSEARGSGECPEGLMLSVSVSSFLGQSWPLAGKRPPDEPERLWGLMGLMVRPEGLRPTSDSAVFSCSHGSDSTFRTFLSPLCSPQFPGAKKSDRWQQPVRRRGSFGKE